MLGTRDTWATASGLLMLVALIHHAACEAPPVFRVEFETTVDSYPSSFVVEVTRSWAPLGADRFYELVMDGYYDDNGFFRVVPGFVVQFGLAASPQMTRKWRIPIKDDPVLQSNVLGTVTFATSGPDSRTTQIFINLADNSALDGQGFAPFGRVVDEGMGVVRAINSEYRQLPQQGQISNNGNGYLKVNFPNLDYTTTVALQQAAVISTISPVDRVTSVFSKLVSSDVNPHQVSLYEDSTETTNPEIIALQYYASDDDSDRRVHSTIGVWMPWIVLGGLAGGLFLTAFGGCSKIKRSSVQHRAHPV